jgi:uncharacterized membrane protein
MKLNKIWSLILVVLGISWLLLLVAEMLELDWPIKQYFYIPSLIIGILLVGKILMWDWNEKKKDSTDKSFKLRK